MSTKIDLEYPYKDDWMKGYLVTNGKGRRTVILYNSNEHRSSTAYARYKMAVSCGRYLLDTEHVDHIDHNKSNDELYNLQILSISDNNLKESKRRGKVVVEMICSYCDELFVRRLANSCLAPRYSNRVFCCGKTCSYKLKKKMLTKEKREDKIRKQFVRKFRLHE